MQAITFTMVGTERSGQYEGVAADLAQVGLRRLGSNVYRLRVEPSTSVAAIKLSPFFTRANGWKQPGDGGQNRFSKCVRENELRDTLEAALTAVTAEGRVHDDSKAPDLMRELLIGIGLSKVPDRKHELDQLALSSTPEAVDDTQGKRSVGILKSMLVIGRALGVRGLSPRWKPETIRRRILDFVDATSNAREDLTIYAKHLGVTRVSSRWKTETLFDRTVAARS